MTILKALTLLFGTTITLGLIGSSIGYSLGRFNPGYYRTVFRNGAEPDFDPVAVGIGQGLTQGTVGGVAVGMALIALFTWRDIRMQRTPADSKISDRSAAPKRNLLLASAILFGLGLSCVGGGVIGTGLGDIWARHRQFDAQRELVAPILASDAAFKKVVIEDGHSGTGRMLLDGPVPTKADQDRLLDRLTHAIGEEGAKYAMRGVRVAMSQ
jgi:hypothetical protein